MRTIEYWDATSNSDLTEGRGYTKVIGSFESKGLAESVVMDKRYARYCVMGVQTPNDSKYHVTHRIVTIHNDAEEFWNNTPEEIRKRAIAKLDADEIRILGIKV